MGNPVISRSPEVMGRTAVFSGDRVPVQTLLDCLESQLEEAFLFLIPGFDTNFDKINNDTVGAGTADLCHGFHPARYARRKAYALTDGLFGNRHENKILHIAPEFTRRKGGCVWAGLWTRKLKRELALMADGQQVHRRSRLGIEDQVIA